MKVEMIPRRGGPQIGFLEVMLVIAIIAVISAVAIPSLLQSKRAYDRTVNESLEGKHVVVKGFDEVGLVTGIDDGRLLVYFPKTGEVKFKREMLRVVEPGK